MEEKIVLASFCSLCLSSAESRELREAGLAVRATETAAAGGVGSAVHVGEGKNGFAVIPRPGDTRMAGGSRVGRPSLEGVRLISGVEALGLGERVCLPFDGPRDGVEGRGGKAPDGGGGAGGRLAIEALTLARENGEVA